VHFLEKPFSARALDIKIREVLTMPPGTSDAAD
jgi:hypothetical protein